MTKDLVLIFCITGSLFLPGGIFGFALLLIPHKISGLSSKAYDKINLFNFNRRVDPHSKTIIIGYRVLGLICVLFSAIPFLIFFYGCVLHECVIN